ncbi:hypothetical protein E2C01_093658 [Portunus trituberculatus]|uniref:Uncharacterized protein n=1 Tax=Portunus trituberculatus TaxID=210409 RepID=A0A5B7JUS1_PORTR|nr:hypothetical protein [Portunus trituberculatus]
MAAQPHVMQVPASHEKTYSAAPFGRPPEQAPHRWPHISTRDTLARQVPYPTLRQANQQPFRRCHPY